MNNIESKDIQLTKEISLYPFNGRSSYLIDKFYIIGFNTPTLNKILLNKDFIKKLINDKPKIKITDEDKNTLQTFHIEEEPILLNEFASDYSKNCLSFEMTKEMIIPNKINLFYIEEDESNFKPNNDDDFEQYEDTTIYKDENMPESYNVIFSSNPQVENNTKKSINGFAYIFYSKYIKKMKYHKKSYTFYIPSIFCIISEYPYFNSFYELCLQIKSLFNYKKIEVPIEIMLYNIINSTVSPIKGDVVLSIEPFSLGIMDEDSDITKKYSFKLSGRINEVDEEDSEENSSGILTNKERLTKKKSEDMTSFDNSKLNAVKPLKKFMKKRTQNYNSNTELTTKINNIEKANSPDNYRYDRHRKSRKTFVQKPKKINEYFGNENKIFKKIKFGFLPGYPLIQYNLAKVLLNTISPSDVITIFLYTFLEKDVLIFSKNLEYLSFTINTYLNLNYPLNDEKYYFLNASVSFDNYFNNNSRFVGSTFTTILGINDQYQAKYINGCSKLKDHLAVDLDKGEIYKVDDKNDNENSKKNKELFNWIKKLCKKDINSGKNQHILSSEVSLLYKKLCDIKNMLNNSEKEYDETNKHYLNFKNGRFIEYDDSNDNYIKKINLDIQNSFYRFTNNLCLYFYKNLSLKTEGDDKNTFDKGKAKTNALKNTDGYINVIYRNNDEEENEYVDEEKYFLNELRDTMKYESFVYSFVQSYSPIDLYKIPLTFAEEFMSIISRKNSILEKNINFLSIIDKLYQTKGNHETDIDFTPFFTSYFLKHRSYFEREINDFNEINCINPDLIKVKFNEEENNSNKFLIYRDYELDMNILMKYLHKVNDIDKEEYSLMLSMTFEKNVPRHIFVTDIENLIEDYSIQSDFLLKSDLCCANIILLFSLSLSSLKSNIESFSSFLGILFQDFILFRKYYSYIMNIIYKLFSDSVSKGDYIQANSYLMCYYPCVNSIKLLKLVPNENLVNIIKKFDTIDTEEFHKNCEEQNNENKKSGVKSNNINLNTKEKIKDTLYVCNNYTSKNFIKEKEIIMNINNVEKSDDSNELNVKINGETITPKIRYFDGVNKFDSFFFRQTTLLTNLIKEYNKYISDLKEENIGYKIILDACLNILIFMRNSDEFKDKSEISDIIKMILLMSVNKINEAK